MRGCAGLALEQAIGVAFHAFGRDQGTQARHMGRKLAVWFRFTNTTGRSDEVLIEGVTSYPCLDREAYVSAGPIQRCRTQPPRTLERWKCVSWTRDRFSTRAFGTTESNRGDVEVISSGLRCGVEYGIAGVDGSDNRSARGAYEVLPDWAVPGSHNSHKRTSMRRRRRRVGSVWRAWPAGGFQLPG